MLIDEFQHVPELLDAIKAELNLDTRPGRFILTGSTRYTVLPQAAQSLTGRAHVVNVLPLSQGELDGHRERFIDLLWQDPERIPPAAVPACSQGRVRQPDPGRRLPDDPPEANFAGAHLLVR